MGNCCSAPAADGGVEITRQERQAPLNVGDLPTQAAPAAGNGVVVPKLNLHSQDDEFYDARQGAEFGDADGFYTARTSATAWESEDEWHDAESELGLADALERFEEERQLQLEVVDQAIEDLRSKHTLVPRAIELSATERGRVEEEAAERLQRNGSLRPSTSGARLASEPLPEQLARLLSQKLQSQKRAQELLARLRHAVQQERPLEAAELLQGLGAEVGASPGQLASLGPEALGGLDPLAIEHRAEEVQETLRQLYDDEGWMVSRSDNLRMLYQHQRGTTIHSLKFQATFDHPIEHLLALAHEFDLVSTWNKFSLESLKLAEPSIWESYVYGAQWMPPPFRNFQGIIHANGLDLAASHRCLLVHMQTIEQAELPPGSQPLPPGAPKRKWLTMLPHSCVLLRPVRLEEEEEARAGLSGSRKRGSKAAMASSKAGTAPVAGSGAAGEQGPAHRTEAHLLCHLDPKIPFIPAFLVNFVLGVLAPYIYNEMKRVLDSNFSDPESIYNQRIRDQPELYGTLHRRLEEFKEELLSAPPSRAASGLTSRVASGASAAAVAAAGGTVHAVCSTEQRMNPGQ